MKKIAIATCYEKPEGTEDDRHLVRALRAQGAQVEFFDWKRIDFRRFDLVLIRSCWDYHKKVKEFLNWASQSHAIKTADLVNSFVTMRWNSDKRYLFDLPVPFVPSFILENVNDLKQERFLRFIEPYAELVLKPTVSASSFLTYRKMKTDDLQEYTRIILGHSAVLVQPFIQSILNQGEISLILFKRENEILFSHAVLKKSSGEDFRVQADFGGSVEEFVPNQKLLDLAEDALKRVPGDWSYARVDIVDWLGKSPLVSEIEMIEPELFFRFNPDSAFVFADILLS